MAVWQRKCPDCGASRSRLASPAISLRPSVSWSLVLYSSRMSKLVFVLGAGCSAAAGAPTMLRFLDRAEFIGRSGELIGDDPTAFDLVFKAYDCLQSIYSKSSEIDLLNIESLFAAFEMAESIGDLRGLIKPHSVSQLIPALTRVIVRTIERSVVIPGDGMQAPVPYGQFCDWVKSRLRETSIITFNY